jgi:hypothetical protein
VTIGLFEVTKTSGVTMFPKLRELLNKISLTLKFFAYIEDEGSILQTCVSALTSIVSCYFLALLKPFDGSYLGHTLSKVYQYATIDEKVDTRLSFASIKAIQFIIQKCVTRLKKFNTWVGKHGRKLALNLN